MMGHCAMMKTILLNNAMTPIALRQLLSIRLPHFPAFRRRSQQTGHFP
jgi:hypothetical protein